MFSALVLADMPRGGCKGPINDVVAMSAATTEIAFVAALMLVFVS